MAIASDVEPVKVGLLMDCIMPGGGERTPYKALFEMVFGDALEAGRIDRPIEVHYREVQGLPRGTVKAVIDAYGELVDEGCVIVIGPNISENTPAVKEAIETRFHVPSLGMAGSDRWLGEWTFNLCNGSMSDEPAFIANLCAREGHERIGVIYERSTIGVEYLSFLRRFALQEGLQIVCETVVAQNSVNAQAAVQDLKASNCDAVVYFGFGLGILGFNEALAEVNWDPPRYAGTAFLAGYSNDMLHGVYTGWVGLDQYDDDNQVAQKFFDRCEQVFGTRFEYFMPLLIHDLGNSVIEALANAQPLSPRGMKESLERVKMLPAAAGSPGTRISFGEWTHRGWMGAGYLTARKFTGEGKKSALYARFEG